MSTGNKHRTKLIAAGCMAAMMLTVAGAYADDDDRTEDRDRAEYGMQSDCGWGRGMGRGARLRFQAIDQNGDGVINDDEAAANAEAVFTMMDADGTGEITEKEYMSVRMGRGFRRNKARQAAMQKRKKARFPQMDADKNKMVSQAEFLAAAQKRFAATDHDGDGQVTPWEFRSNRRIFWRAQGGRNSSNLPGPEVVSIGFRCRVSIIQTIGMNYAV